MSDDTRRVLELLAQDKISVDEAQQLLRALTDESTRTEAPTTGGVAPSKPRHIRISVHKPAKPGHEPKDVNIRVPLSLVRAGMRLGTMIPGLQNHVSARMKENGMDVDLGKLDPALIESMLAEMGEINIDVNSGEQVRITCE